MRQHSGASLKKSVSIKQKNMDILDCQSSKRNTSKANHSKQNFRRKSGAIIDCNSSVSSFDSSISDKIDNYTAKSVDGTIKKTLIIQGTVLVASSITIETVIKLSKTGEKSKNNSAKVFQTSEEPPHAEPPNDVSYNSESPKQAYQTDATENSTIGHTFNSNELCAEKQVKEIKRLIDFIKTTIKSKRESHESNVPSQVEKLHQKMENFKNHTAHLIESERNWSHRTSSYRKTINKSQKSLTPSTSPSKSLRAKEIDEMEIFYPQKNHNFHLNLSSGRQRINKKQVLNQMPDVCRKCNPLNNSNRCVPYTATTYHTNLTRRATICFCYCAYTKGSDGITYHTLCQCCGPTTNF